MAKSIVDLNQCLYIPAIQKLALHLSHIQMIGTHHCGKKLREELKCCVAY